MSNNVYFTFFTSRWQLRLMIGLSFNVILCEKMLSNGMSHYNCDGSHAFNLSERKKKENETSLEKCEQWLTFTGQSYAIGIGFCF